MERIEGGVSLHPEEEFLSAYEAVFGPGQSWKLRSDLTVNDPSGPGSTFEDNVTITTFEPVLTN